jgi:glycosyltransferase involved in cell wall biosynthesis
VVFLSGREPGYIRNRVLLRALRQIAEVEVLTPERGGTVRRMALGLSRAAARRAVADVYFAGFYGQPLAIGLAALHKRPVLLDGYVSTYDTLCQDRYRFGAASPICRVARWVDHRGCQSAQVVLTDTVAYARFYADTFGIPLSKLVPVYVGCDERVFAPRTSPCEGRARTDVFYYGAFLPLHGTEVIIRAAAQLRHRRDVRFVIGGDGMRRKAVETLIEDLGLDNVEMLGWIPFDRLPDHIARATICLGGHFSTIAKAARVVSTKTFQFVAMHKPTIVGDNAATRELFTPDEHVVSVPMGDAHALAEAVSRLAGDSALRERVADGGYEVFRRRLTTEAIASQLDGLLDTLVAGG